MSEAEKELPPACGHVIPEPSCSGCWLASIEVDRQAPPAMTLRQSFATAALTGIAASGMLADVVRVPKDRRVAILRAAIAMCWQLADEALESEHAPLAEEKDPTP